MIINPAKSSKTLKIVAILFARSLSDMRVSSTYYNVDGIGMFLDYSRKGLDHRLNPLVRRKQAEGQDNLLSFHTELILVKFGSMKGISGIPW